MARNKIATNRALFSNFTSFISLNGGDRQLTERARWISSTPDEQDQLINAKVVDSIKLNLTEYIVCRCYLWHEEIYFFVSGLYTDFYRPTNIIRVEPPNGILTAFIVESEISILNVSSPLEIYDEFEETEVEGDTFSGFSIYSVLKFYPNISCYKITDIQNFQMLNVVYEMIISSRRNISLPINSQILEAIQQMVITDKYPTISLVEGVIAQKFENLFMSVYHCLEHFYGRSKLSYIKDRLQIQLDYSQIAVVLEEVLGLRQREEEAICDICADAEEEINRTNIVSALSNWEVVRGYTNVGKQIYKVRNSIVHSRLANERPQYSKFQWNEIIYGISIVALTLNE